MGDTIGRILCGARPIDTAMLVIELFVLLIIAVAELVRLVHWLSTRRTLAHLSNLDTEKDALRMALYKTQTSQENAQQWEQRAVEWMSEAESFCRKCSPQALEKFEQEAGIDFPGMPESIRKTVREFANREHNFSEIVSRHDLYI